MLMWLRSNNCGLWLVKMVKTENQARGLAKYVFLSFLSSCKVCMQCPCRLGILRDEEMPLTSAHIPKFPPCLLPCPDRPCPPGCLLTSALSATPWLTALFLTLMTLAPPTELKASLMTSSCTRHIAIQRLYLGHSTSRRPFPIDWRQWWVVAAMLDSTLLLPYTVLTTVSIIHMKWYRVYHPTCPLFWHRSFKRW